MVKILIQPIDFIRTRFDKRSFYRVLLLISTLLCFLGAARWYMNYQNIVLNRTPSHVPCGLYQKILQGEQLKNYTFKRGDIVSFDYSLLCKRFPSLYDKNHKYNASVFVKIIGAVAGDVITVSKHNNICVNGRELQGTPLVKYPDGSLRQKVKYPLTVSKNAVYLVKEFTPYSYDSRYFGEVPVDMILSVQRSVVSW